MVKNNVLFRAKQDIQLLANKDIEKSINKRKLLELFKGVVCDISKPKRFPLAVYVNYNSHRLYGQNYKQHFFVVDTSQISPRSAKETIPREPILGTLVVRRHALEFPIWSSKLNPNCH